jgi:putative two-component system response regulator
MGNSEKSILIIDDDKHLAFGMSKVLARKGYTVQMTHEGHAGISAALKELPDVILLDIGLPNTDGFEIKTILNQNPILKGIPVIFVSARSDISAIQQGLAMGSYDYITKPFHTEILIAKIEGILARRKETYDMLRGELKDVRETMIEETLIGWANALDLRMYGETGHSERVTEYTIQLAELVGYPAEKMNELRRGAILHDIGKIGIPDAILFKNGKLDEEEWGIMRRHPLLAKEILEDVKSLGAAIEIPVYHHENFDGSGYPFGLKGKEIPLAARIFAIIDVLDALCSERPYRPAFPPDECIEIIREEQHHFDPHVLAVFLQNREEFTLEYEKFDKE